MSQASSESSRASAASASENDTAVNHDDGGTSSSAEYPTLAKLLKYANLARVAPSSLAQNFDPENPTTEQRKTMDASKKSLLPLLLHLARRPGVQVVGTSNWHQVNVLQFGTAPEYSSRFPLLVYWDGTPAVEPRFPADADEYAAALTSRSLRKNWYTLSLWVEARLIRWDLTRAQFAWFGAAVAAAGPIVFGIAPGRAPAANSATSATAPQPAGPTAAAERPKCGACSEFDVHGILPCRICIDYRCARCLRPPTIPGTAVMPPGQSAVAWHPCPHGGGTATSAPPAPALSTAATAAAAAAVESAIAAAASPSVETSASEAPPTAALGIDSVDASGARTDATVGGVERPDECVSTTAAAVVTMTTDSAAMPLTDATVDQSIAPNTGIGGNGDGEAQTLLSIVMGVDGGPRGEAHPEDRPPPLAPGPCDGLPRIPLDLWQPHLMFAVEEDVVEQALMGVPEVPRDTAVQDWRSLRLWELDDVLAETSTRSCSVPIETPAARKLIESVERSIARRMRCEWGSLECTEMRYLRHEVLNASSAPQNLSRRSADASSRHLCARILLWSADGVHIEHKCSAPELPKRLTVSGQAVLWWTKIGGCPWWGDDEHAVIESTACHADEDAVRPAIERRYAVELFIFWTRDSRQSRVIGIGKGAAIGRGAFPVDDPTVTNALFGRSTLPHPLRDGQTILEFIAEHVCEFTSRAHVSIGVDPARQWMKFVLTIPRRASLEEITYPLRAVPASGDLLLHFSPPSTPDGKPHVRMYVKRPPTVRKRVAPAANTGVEALTDSSSESSGVASMPPPKRKRGRGAAPAAVTPASKPRLSGAGAASARRSVAMVPTTPEPALIICDDAPWSGSAAPKAPQRNERSDLAIVTDALVQVVKANNAAAQSPGGTAGGDVRKLLEERAERAETAAAAALADAQAAKIDAERLRAEIARLEKENADLQRQLAEKQGMLKTALEMIEYVRTEAKDANSHIRQHAIHAATAGPAYQAQILGMSQTAIIQASGREMTFPAMPAPPAVIPFGGLAPMHFPPRQ